MVLNVKHISPCAAVDTGVYPSIFDSQRAHFSRLQHHTALTTESSSLLLVATPRLNTENNLYAEDAAPTVLRVLARAPLSSSNGRYAKHEMPRHDIDMTFAQKKTASIAC